MCATERAQCISTTIPSRAFLLWLIKRPDTSPLAVSVRLPGTYYPYPICCLEISDPHALVSFA